MPRTDSRSIHISLPSGDYDVLVGAGLVDRSECFATDLIGADVLIVTNETVAPLYHDRLLMALGRRRVEAWRRRAFSTSWGGTGPADQGRPVTPWCAGRWTKRTPTACWPAGR